jgi:hypothetical protein
LPRENRIEEFDFYLSRNKVSKHLSQKVDALLGRFSAKYPVLMTSFFSP